MYQFYFEKLEVWKNSRKLFFKIYDVTKALPSDERYNFSNQLRRAVTSVAINLAEGSSRNTRKDQAKFTSIAYGSLMEVTNLVIFCKDLAYIEMNDYNEIRREIDIIAKQLNALRNKQMESES